MENFNLGVAFLLSTALVISSIPFGLVFTSLFGLGDLRSIGSGNVGATNALRTGNKKVAILTLIFDMLKGAVPTGLSIYVYGLTDLTYLIGMICILGHVFSFFLKFKGGKGIATALGVYLALNPLVGFISIALWLVSLKVSKISSLSALISFVLTPLVSYGLYYRGLSDIEMVLFSSLVMVLILWTHRSNIQRLVRGEESKV